MGKRSDAKYPALYDDMRKAIANCHRVDECKDIADKAVAMTAYYQQVKDDTSVRKFHSVRLRALRQMGKIVAKVDTSDCKSHQAKCARIREAMQDPTTQSLNNWWLGKILKLAELPDAGFEAAIDRCAGSITKMLELGDPEEIARRAKGAAEWSSQQWNETADKIEEEAETLAQDAEEIAEDAEVGLTLKAELREPMKPFYFLIKVPVHEQLRQAAFDHRTTMWAILREGLDIWFKRHGYPGTMPGDIGFSRKSERAGFRADFSGSLFREKEEGR